VFASAKPASTGIRLASAFFRRAARCLAVSPPMPVPPDFEDGVELPPPEGVAPPASACAAGEHAAASAAASATIFKSLNRGNFNRNPAARAALLDL